MNNFQKYFVMNEIDKFSFIQFADNGKKTAFFNPEPLNYFLVKFQKTKGTFEFTDSFTTNSSTVFMELYNIFDSILKNYTSVEESDNIIIIFTDFIFSILASSLPSESSKPGVSIMNNL